MTTPDAQECRRRALWAMSEAKNSTISAEQFRDWLAEAQVWATLATVPEPLDEIHGQILDSAEPSRAQLISEAFHALPLVTCPHGYAARASLIREPDKEPEIYFTWRVDGGCPRGCP